MVIHRLVILCYVQFLATHDHGKLIHQGTIVDLATSYSSG